MRSLSRSAGNDPAAVAASIVALMDTVAVMTAESFTPPVLQLNTKSVNCVKYLANSRVLSRLADSSGQRSPKPSRRSSADDHGHQIPFPSPQTNEHHSCHH